MPSEHQWGMPEFVRRPRIVEEDVIADHRTAGPRCRYGTDWLDRPRFRRPSTVVDALDLGLGRFRSRHDARRHRSHATPARASRGAPAPEAPRPPAGVRPPPPWSRLARAACGAG